MRTIPAAEADKRVSHAPRDTRKRGLTHADVVRFMARERMNRHERKRDRWHQQMFD